MDAPWASVPEWPSACFDSALRAWILVDLWVLCRAGGGGFSPLPATSKSPSFMVAPFDTVSMGDISRGASAPSRVSHDYRDVSFSCPRATRRGGRPSIRRVYVGWRACYTGALAGTPHAHGPEGRCAVRKKKIAPARVTPQTLAPSLDYFIPVAGCRSSAGLPSQ